MKISQERWMQRLYLHISIDLMVMARVDALSLPFKGYNERSDGDSSRFGLFFFLFHSGCWLKTREESRHEEEK